MQTREQIVEKTRSFIGVPWKHQGRNRLGIDCVGLVIIVGNEMGLIDYTSNNYQRHGQGTTFLREFRAGMMVEKKLDEAKPGDVLLFRDKQYPCHSAIVGEKKGRLTIIHAHALHRKVLEEELEQGDWLIRRVACFSYPNVEE